MEKYANLSGKSGVASFEIGEDFICIKFRDGSKYLYNNERTEFSNIQKMILLARSGKGLNSFINRNVKDMYAKKY